MSYSSLWVMDKNYVGSENTEYSNSWLFSPIAWDVLLTKYMPHKSVNPFSHSKCSFLSATMFDNTVNNTLNRLINNTDEQSDRVLWELCNQQVFSSKDRKFVSDSIKRFLEINKKYDNHLVLNSDRWNEIAEDILRIDETEWPYFVFKNSSCDDNVEYWFSKYNEDEDEYEERSLKDVEKYVCEFVVVEDNKISKFISNMDYFA